MTNATKAIFQTVSKPGTTRIVEVEAVGDGLMARFSVIRPFDRPLVSRPQSIRGTLSRLEAFVGNQPGMFALWVDTKLGIASRK